MLPAGSALRHRDRQVRVAAGDVVTLVRLPEHAEAARRLVPEQVDEVERRLVGRLRAVLLVVCGVEQRPEPRAEPAGNVVRDPVVHRHLVEHLTGRRRAVVQRRIAGRLQLLLEGLRDALEVDGRLVRCVVGAEDPVRILGTRRLRRQKVDCGEIELLREPEDLLVPRVDELAAELGLLAVVPEVVTELGPVGVHAPADAVGRLVHVGVHALVLEDECCVEARDAAADDGDAGTGRAPGCTRMLGEVRGAGDHAGAGDAGLLQELAAVVCRAFGSPALQLGNRNPQHGRLRDARPRAAAGHGEEVSSAFVQHQQSEAGSQVH